MWKGDNFTERLTYDMTDPAIVGRAGFGVIDTSAAPSAVTPMASSAKAGACSSMARWDVTTRRASPTG